MPSAVFSVAQASSFIMKRKLQHRVHVSDWSLTTICRCSLPVMLFWGMSYFGSETSIFSPTYAFAATSACEKAAKSDSADTP